jgi:hypothetical protein
MIINKLAKFLPLLAILVAEPTFATSNYRSSESLYRSPALQPINIANNSQCLKWDVEIPFTVKQDNGWTTVVTIRPQGEGRNNTWGIKGTAISRGRDWNDYMRINGQVTSGSLIGSSLLFTIAWDNKTVGHYEGTFDSEGNFKGNTYDELNSGATYNWTVSRRFGCVMRG